ncbi:MAG: glutamyl-tRNA reductase, partial [Actinobacteria bacterium]
MSVVVIGLNHRIAPLEILERTSVDGASLPKALDDLCARQNVTEAVLLSTCNRVEIYTAAEDPAAGPSHEQVAEFMAEFHRLPMYEIFNELFERTGEDAVRHLF